MRRTPLGLFLAGLLVAGCGGRPPAITLENGTFYQFDDQPGASAAFEQPYPPLNQSASPGHPEYVGVSVIDGTVHISRPVDWKIRRAGLQKNRRFIEYVSPNEYLFAVYERTDSPGDSWDDMLGLYEKDAKAKGAEVLGEQIPIATWNAQGREYTLRRTIKGQRAPYTHVSSEAILRGDHHVELVEIVHQGESIAPIGGELLRVMETLQVQ